MGRMSESISELHKAIESRCKRVTNALDDCPKTGLLFFYRAIRIILTASRGANSEQELRALLPTRRGRSDLAIHKRCKRRRGSQFPALGKVYANLIPQFSTLIVEVFAVAHHLNPVAWVHVKFKRAMEAAPKTGARWSGLGWKVPVSKVEVWAGRRNTGFD